MQSGRRNPKNKPTRGNTEPENKLLKAQPRKGRKGDTPLGYSGRTALRREQCSMDGQSVASNERGVARHGTTRHGKHRLPYCSVIAGTCLESRCLETL
jgi:hypothetical protein